MSSAPMASWALISVVGVVLILGIGAVIYFWRGD